MRDRLVELLYRAHHNASCVMNEGGSEEEILEEEARYLLKYGVILPPCKVGDTVYTNTAMQGWYYRTKDRPYTARIVFIGVNDSEEMGCGYINVLFEKNHNMMQFRLSDIGKTVFLTREEAEQALKGEHNAEIH